MTTKGRFNDTMHASLFGLVVFVAVALSAVAYRGWFRLYAIAPIPILVGFGAASSVAIQGIEQNFTPWAGGFERLNAYSYFGWLVALALTVRRSLDQNDGALRSDDDRSESSRQSRTTNSTTPACRRARDFR